MTLKENKKEPFKFGLDLKTERLKIAKEILAKQPRYSYFDLEKMKFVKLRKKDIADLEQFKKQKEISERQFITFMKTCETVPKGTPLKEILQCFPDGISKSLMGKILELVEIKKMKARFSRFSKK